MPGFMPGMTLRWALRSLIGMAGTSPAMTTKKAGCHCPVDNRENG